MRSASKLASRAAGPLRRSPVGLARVAAGFDDHRRTPGPCAARPSYEAVRPMATQPTMPGAPGSGAGGRGGKGKGGKGVGDMPLGRVLAYSGLGLLGVTAFFPVAVFKVSLSIAGLMVGRNVMARLAGWPESKRAFFSRVMMLSVRRIMQGAMRRQSIQTFLAGSAAQITQEGLLRSMKDVAAL